MYASIPLSAALAKFIIVSLISAYFGSRLSILQMVLEGLGFDNETIQGMVGLSVFRVGGWELEACCSNDLQRSVLAQPGGVVRFLAFFYEDFAASPAPELPQQVDALLVQSRGLRRSTMCACCSRLKAGRPFWECKVFEGYWDGRCGGCIWGGPRFVCADDREKADDEEFGISAEEMGDSDLEEDAAARARN